MLAAWRPAAWLRAVGGAPAAQVSAHQAQVTQTSAVARGLAATVPGQAGDRHPPALCAHAALDEWQPQSRLAQLVGPCQTYAQAAVACAVGQGQKECAGGGWAVWTRLAAADAALGAVPAGAAPVAAGHLLHLLPAGSSYACICTCACFQAYIQSQYVHAFG